MVLSIFILILRYSLQLSSELFDSSKFLPPDSSQDPIFPPALRVSDMNSSDDCMVMLMYFDWNKIFNIEGTYWYLKRSCHCWLNWWVLTKVLSLLIRLTGTDTGTVIVDWTDRYWHKVLSLLIIQADSDK